MNIWWHAIRPKTLTASLVPVAVGATLAYIHSLHHDSTSHDWSITILAVAASLAIQIATNLFNDALDFKKGADRHDRLGEARLSQRGWATPSRIITLGSVFLGLALICGLPLVIHGGWPIVVIGVVSLFLAYGYTGGPFPLAYKGLGDFFVILFFGVIAVGGVYFLHTKTWTVGALIAGLQIGFLAAALIAINNLRDIEQDKRANKLTLAVRLGTPLAKYEIIGLLLAPFLLGCFWWSQNIKLAGLLPVLILPVAISLCLAVWRTPPSPQYNGFLARSALIHMLFGSLLCTGLIYS